MSAPYSPDGTFPTMPMTLPDTGVVGELLTAFAASSTGAMGQLVNATGWLKDRATFEALIESDGAGGASLLWATTDEEGEPWVTDVSLGTYGSLTCFVLTHATFVATSSWCIEADVQRASNEATLVSYRVFPEVILDTAALNKTAIRITHHTGANLDPGSNPWRVLVSLTKAATL